VIILAVGVAAWRLDFLDQLGADANTTVVRSDGGASLSTSKYQLEAEAGTFKSGQRSAAQGMDSRGGAQRLMAAREYPLHT
jgi:hypothetical protein